MANTNQKTLFDGERGWTLWMWPLVIVIEDCFVPQSAQLILEVAAEQTNETHALLWALAGMRASGEWSRN